MANPLVCIFNPITTLIDEIPSSSIFTGASAAGQPVVLNLQGVIDPSLIGQGTSATAGELLVSGALVNLYDHGGALYMQNAYAAAVGVAPSGASYPVSAMGFVNTNVSINNTALVLFSGAFVYGDPNSEFTATDIGAEVYLSQVTPGGITKTRPSGLGQLQQAVGTVIGFRVPNFVSVAFVSSPQPPFNDFNNIATGINTTATMTVGTGASLVVTGTGVVEATQVQAVVVSATPPSLGEVLTATGATAANWQTPSTAFSVITTGVNSAATMTVNTGASIVVTGTGVVEATQLWAVLVSSTPPSIGQAPVATSPTAASWAAVELGSQYQSIRSSVGTVNAGTLGGPFTVNFSPAYADNNYTVEVTALVGEAISTAPCYVGGVQQNGTGAGVFVWVSNNDSINHTVFVNVLARHD